MKFARYLEQTQIPEWKKKYINYKGLKKQISAIRRDRDEKKSKRSLRSALSPEQPFSTNSPESYRPRASSGVGTSLANRTPRGDSLLGTPQPQQYGSSGKTPPLNARAKRSPSVRMMLPAAHEPVETFSLPPPARSFTENDLSATVGLATGIAQRPRGFSFRRSKTNIAADFARTSFESYDALLAGVGPLEKSFFEYLDAEIDKAEEFYNERYREATIRFTALKEQIAELVEHRRIHHASQDGIKAWTWKAIPYVPALPAQAIEAAYKGFSKRVSFGKEVAADVVENIATATNLPFQRDPEMYHTAKKELKHAIQEFHRFLEYLKNFQALNVTAIRKSIKKFEKTAIMNIHDLFNRERVNGLALSSDKEIKVMVDELERIYAARFEGGDLKKARNRLRTLNNFKTHHFSVFRSGMQVGLAIPALVVGFYQALQPHTRVRLPYCWPLLEVYAALGIPVIFSLLVGLNIVAWARKRINYVFIFELDLRSVLDYREYFELPSFLFVTLSYAFMLSFSGLFDSHITPTTWPLAWIVLFLVVLFDPLTFMHSSSRFWLLRNWSRLALPGLYPVEFADFWMADEYCSMTFTLSHLYFVGCVYSNHWNNPTQTCNLASNWVAGIILASIPSFIRLLQCIKRYADSKNHIHLINGGKYASSIISICVFFNWRSHGMPSGGHHFFVWIFISIIASVYTSAWDLLMDWSLLSRGSRFRLLRPEILYSEPLYYFAMVTNILIRFVWVIYIAPGRGFDYRIRNATAAILEMLRRVQWNFIRVENEHLGNADQYRVTREVPLPYSFDNAEQQDDSDDDENDKRKPRSSKNDAASRRVPSRESFVEPPIDRPQSVRLAAIASNDDMTAV